MSPFFGAISLSPGANWSFCLNFLVQYPFLLCAGASRLAPSPPIWSWPSLQWVAFLSLHCAMCIGTHPPCYNGTTVSYSCTLYTVLALTPVGRLPLTLVVGRHNYSIGTHPPYMLQCYNVAMSQCHNITISQYHNITMPQCHHVTMSQCYNVTVVQWIATIGTSSHVNMFHLHSVQCCTVVTTPFGLLASPLMSRLQSARF